MKLCPNCKSPIDGGNHLCRHCYSAYKRNIWSSDPIARAKQKARTKALKALKSGLIFKHNCVCCGSEESEMHHPDYSKPLDVVWYCDPCHHNFHVIERKALCV